MQRSKPKTAYMTVRVTDSIRTKFYTKASKYGKPSDVMRELIEALVEDRLVIQPPVKKESLYVTRIED